MYNKFYILFEYIGILYNSIQRTLKDSIIKDSGYLKFTLIDFYVRANSICNPLSKLFGSARLML